MVKRLRGRPPEEQYRKNQVTWTTEMESAFKEQDYLYFETEGGDKREGNSC